MKKDENIIWGMCVVFALFFGIFVGQLHIKEDMNSDLQALGFMRLYQTGWDCKVREVSDETK